MWRFFFITMTGVFFCLPAVITPRYLIRTPYNGVLASQTRHDYYPQSSMIRGGCHRVWWGAGNR